MVSECDFGTISVKGGTDSLKADCNDLFDLLIFNVEYFNGYLRLFWFLLLLQILYLCIICNHFSMS